MRLGAGGVLLFVLVLPPCCSLLIHPQSTPQAVAHEAGGGWCIVVQSSCPSPHHHCPCGNLLLPSPFRGGWCCSFVVNTVPHRFLSPVISFPFSPVISSSSSLFLCFSPCPHFIVPAIHPVRQWLTGKDFCCSWNTGLQGTKHPHKVIL